MGWNVHEIEKKKEARYRIWSNNTDTYVTDEITAEEVSRHFLSDALYRAISSHLTSEKRNPVTARPKKVKRWPKEKKQQSEKPDENAPKSEWHIEYELYCRLTDAAFAAVEAELAKK